jgi:Predicted membrane protein (DUF2127)
MPWLRRRDLLDQTFQVGILLKGLDGLLEVLGGLLLLVVCPATIDRVVTSLTQHELAEDPHDVLATRLLRTAHGLTGAAVLVAAVYLLGHGMVKVVLVAAPLTNQLWPLPGCWPPGCLQRLPAPPAAPQAASRAGGVDELGRGDRLLQKLSISRRAKASRDSRLAS